MSEDTTCRDVHAQASAFVDGELDPKEWTSFRSHLGDCPPCEEYVRQIGLTVELLRRLPGRPGHDARAELVRRFEAWAGGRGRK